VVRIPATRPPAGLVVKTLIRGTGSRVTRRQLVVVQYVGVNWRTGKVFGSSWSQGAPYGFQIGVTPPQVIAGWDSGLLGARTGSRILMVVPPSEGYGTAGNQQAGIRGTDTLVFVIDVLGTVNLSLARLEPGEHREHGVVGRAIRDRQTDTFTRERLHRDAC
jgi:peptidylprolyl isomerase